MLERTPTGSEVEKQATDYSPIIFEKGLSRTIPVVSSYTRYEQFGDIDQSDNHSYKMAYSRTVWDKIYKVISTKQINDTLIAMVALFTQIGTDVVQEPFSPLIVVEVGDKANTTQKARDIHEQYLLSIREKVKPNIEVVVDNPAPASSPSAEKPPFGQVTAIPPHKIPGGARKKKTMRKHKKTRKYRRSNRRRAFKRDGL